MESSSSITSLERRALVLLINAILDQLDEVASLRARGNSARVSSIILNDMTSVLYDMDDRLRNAYFEMLPVLCPTEARTIRIEDEESTKLLADPRKRLIREIRADLKLRAA